MTNQSALPLVFFFYTQIQFKPAYNPYTEPSMEIFGYHPDLKKWTEIGNSGMFRPEMLLPMGLPKVCTRTYQTAYTRSIYTRTC